MTENKKNKPKILYVITKSNWGGAQRYLFDLATNFQNDFEVVVALGGDGLLQKKLEERAVKIIPIGNLERDVGLIKEFSAFFNLLRIISSEKPDIIHLNSSKVGGLGSLAGRFCNLFGKTSAKIIFTVHGWPFNETRSWWQIFLIKVSSYLSVLFSHRTIAVSKKDYKDGLKFPFVSGKISLVHNGIGNVNFKERGEARNEILSKINLSDSPNLCLIGTIGELHKNKGLSYLINSIGISLNPNYNIALVIIGDGEEKNSLEKIIEEKELSKKVFLAGRIENAALYLKAFDIFILSSIKEGLPYVLLEAGLAGLPAISTNVGGVPEIIEDMQSGMIVRKKDEKELSKAIIYLLENPEKAEALGNNLKNNIDKNFNLGNMLEETSNIYRH